MFQRLVDLFKNDSLSPHGICLLWDPGLLGMHAVSDLVIGLAYLSIPAVIAMVAAKRPDVKNGWVMWCFVSFITLCGLGHFMSIWTLWSPDYALEGLIKVATAFISLATAVLLWPLLPKMLALPTRAALEQKNAELLAMVAERDQALEMLRQAQRMDALGQLSGTVAHDFNNVLTGVLLNVERLEKKLPVADPMIHRALRNIRLAGERGSKIAGQMLAFARSQPHEEELTVPDQAINDLAPLLVDATADEIEIDLALDAPRCGIRVDVSQFETALVNLVVNARDAMPNGGKVTISSWKDTLDGMPQYVVEVADQGLGMLREVREKAVQPFFTTKPEGKGTGLGLAQVCGFVRRAGGEVHIDSDVGQGTRVRLYFPIRGAADAVTVADLLKATS